MTKSVKKDEPSFKAIKGKRKVIKLRDSESVMEGNSVQMPFIAPYRGDIITSLEYKWNVIENGVEITRGIEVSGHGKLGVPTLKDKEVLRALQDIYIRSKVDKGVLELETDKIKIKEEDLMIDFGTVDNIAKAMGYTSTSGQQRQSIKESIERLVATTVFSKHSGGIYDITTKKYITDSKISFRYLDNMQNYTIYDCDNCLFLHGCNKNTGKCLDEKNKRIDITKIKMSEFLYLSIANNYRLYYDKDRTNEIKNLIAKNIYLISRKWIGNGYVSVANIQKYTDRLPVNAQKLKHRKQKIKDAITILDGYDFVEAKIENDIVTIKHLDKKATSYGEIALDKIETKENSYMRDRFNKYSDFDETLRNEFKFTSDDFDKYIDMQKIEHLKAMLRATLIKYNYEKDLDIKEYYTNWIKKCNEKGYKIDEKYYNK
jgi:hypothetical protein